MALVARTAALSIAVRLRPRDIARSLITSLAGWARRRAEKEPAFAYIMSRSRPRPTPGYGDSSRAPRRRVLLRAGRACPRNGDKARTGRCRKRPRPRAASLRPARHCRAVAWQRPECDFWSMA